MRLDGVKLVKSYKLPARSVGALVGCDEYVFTFEPSFSLSHTTAGAVVIILRRLDGTEGVTIIVWLYLSPSILMVQRLLLLLQ